MNASGQRRQSRSSLYKTYHTHTHKPSVIIVHISFQYLSVWPSCVHTRVVCELPAAHFHIVAYARRPPAHTLVQTKSRRNSNSGSSRTKADARALRDKRRCWNALAARSSCRGQRLFLVVKWCTRRAIMVRGPRCGRKNNAVNSLFAAGWPIGHAIVCACVCAAARNMMCCVHWTPNRSQHMRTCAIQICVYCSRTASRRALSSDGCRRRSLIECARLFWVKHVSNYIRHIQAWIALRLCKSNHNKTILVIRVCGNLVRNVADAIDLKLYISFDRFSSITCCWQIYTIDSELN